MVVVKLGRQGEHSRGRRSRCSISSILHGASRMECTERRLDGSAARGQARKAWRAAPPCSWSAWRLGWR
jgi:hypothetical protein